MIAVTAQQPSDTLSARELTRAALVVMVDAEVSPTPTGGIRATNGALAVLAFKNGFPLLQREPVLSVTTTRVVLPYATLAAVVVARSGALIT
jgi:hypothetical protein